MASPNDKWWKNGQGDPPDYDPEEDGGGTLDEPDKHDPDEPCDWWKRGQKPFGDADA